MLNNGNEEDLLIPSDSFASQKDGQRRTNKLVKTIESIGGHFLRASIVTLINKTSPNDFPAITSFAKVDLSERLSKVLSGAKVAPNKNIDEEEKEEYSNSFIEVHTEQDDLSSQQTFAKGEKELMILQKAIEDGNHVLLRQLKLKLKELLSLRFKH